MEAKIVINGRELTEGQSMTVRVALNSFLVDLVENGLGDDEHGKQMCDAYKKCGSEVNLLLMTAPDLPKQDVAEEE